VSRDSTWLHTCERCGREFKGGQGAQFCPPCKLARHRECQARRAARIIAGGPSNTRPKPARRQVFPANGALMPDVAPSKPARKLTEAEFLAGINAANGTRYRTMADYLADLPNRVKPPVKVEHVNVADRTAAESRRGVVGVR
jgi:hypothetical protein